MPSSTRTTRTRLDRTAATIAATPRGEPAGLLLLDRYRLHKPLGAGGFGTVWMARDERLEREVAVKILARDRIVDGRFEREARAAARLSHPGIVTLYEAAVDDDGAYLVSELVRGATLSHLLEAGRLSDRDILEIGIALSAALAHAHGQGVVHRDVKPSNVLIPDQPGSAGQVAKLTDFGVARLIGGDTLTRTGDVVGTAAYMAPEQAAGEEAGATADLYSLALVLYESLTGVNPVAHGRAAQQARRLGAHLPSLRRQRRDLPRELGATLDQALRPRPRDRGSLEELRDALADSLSRVEDAPGVVEARWPERTMRPAPGPGRETQRGFALFSQVPAEGAGRAEAGDPIQERAPLRWPRRALAGVAGGLVGAWLMTLLPNPAPAPPAAPAAAALGALIIAALPRIGWILLVGTMSGILGAHGQPGAATAVALAGLIPIVVLPRHGSSWPLAAVAPALGVLSLAGAWPAVAGRARTTWERIGLGAVGWIWTGVAGALAEGGLYAHLPAGISPGWEESASAAIDHVLPRLLGPALLGPAAIWGGAAALVPWISRRSLRLQVVLASVWAAGLASGTAALLRASDNAIQAPSAVVALGAAGSWVALLAPALIKAWRAGLRSADTAAGLA